MSWLVVKTKHNCEQKAKLNLERQGFTTFLPLVDVEKVIRGKKQVLRQAFFPSYIFAEYDQHCRLYQAKIRSSIGVIQVVSFGTSPSLVADSVITAIRERLMAANVAPVFSKGDAVTVKQGPFAGVDGIFQCSTGEQRATVLLQILANQTRVELGFDEFVEKQTQS